jgi:DNA-binding NarL/FixJ family response regulator
MSALRSLRLVKPAESDPASPKAASAPELISRPPAGREALTYAQSAIVEQLAWGLSTSQAADALGIAVNTVRVQLHFVYRRLGITHRGELMLWAIKHGYGQPPAGSAG